MKVHRWTVRIFLAAMVYLIVILLFGWRENYAAWMTYNDFDMAGAINFIYYMLPGIERPAVQPKYDFSKVHWMPIWLFFGVILSGFAAMRFAVLRFAAMRFAAMRFAAMRLVNTRRAAVRTWTLSFRRGLVQISVFLIARLGILRAAGVCPVQRSALGIFPFLNCQACELASGACPVGTLQMAVLNHSMPWHTLATLFLSGITAGRMICGWLCPFGLLSEIFDRFSLHKRLPSWIHWLKFAFLGLFIVLLLLPLWIPSMSFLPFCSFICPAGVFYGTLPFSVTTGLDAWIAGLPKVHIAWIYHIMLAIGFLLLVRRFSGWIFCIAGCPLGAFFSLFHRIALLQLRFYPKRCNECGHCKPVCPVQSDPTDISWINRSACIGCGQCAEVCTRHALSMPLQIASVHAEKNISHRSVQKAAKVISISRQKENQSC